MNISTFKECNITDEKCKYYTSIPTEQEVLNAIKIMGLFRTPYSHEEVVNVVSNAIKDSEVLKKLQVELEQMGDYNTHLLVDKYDILQAIKVLRGLDNEQIKLVDEGENE